MILSKWKLKAIVQKGISFLPNSEKANYFFQKHITKGVHLNNEHFENKIQHSKDHISFFQKYGETGPDKQIIELGSGWYPIVPIMMYLSNSGRVISVDIQSWMTKETQLTTINKFIDWRKKGKLDFFLTNLDNKRWDKLLEISANPSKYTLDTINKTIGLELLLQDAQHLQLADDSIDLICSNNTFEHIYKEVLSGILNEFSRVIKPNGVMSHFIDMSDHFAHYDKDINIYNFLKYSNKSWNRIDNSIQPQNRLRFEDYRGIYKQLNIPITEESIRPGNINEVQELKIHKEFQHFSLEELAISHGYIISKM